MSHIISLSNEDVNQAYGRTYIFDSDNFAIFNVPPKNTLTTFLIGLSKRVIQRTKMSAEGNGLLEVLILFSNYIIIFATIRRIFFVVHLLQVWLYNLPSNAVTFQKEVNRPALEAFLTMEREEGKKVSEIETKLEDKVEVKWNGIWRGFFAGPRPKNCLLVSYRAQSWPSSLKLSHSPVFIV